jgi:hypothetical protein
MYNILFKGTAKLLGPERALVLREAMRCYASTLAVLRDGDSSSRDKIVDARWAGSFEHIASLKNKHKGKRCFILGNGPSLNRTDLSFLSNEITFGVNRIYLLSETQGFSPTYYVAINELVIEQCASEIQSLNMPRYVGWNCRHLFSPDPGIVFLDRTHELWFSSDLTKGSGGGSTVTYTALQLAYHMGFDEVILIGVDHSFQTKGEPHKVIVSDGDDPNHFSGDYFGKGFKWQLPDLEGSEMDYQMARYRYELDDRRVLDATIGGQLNIFPKVEYASLF